MNQLSLTFEPGLTAQYRDLEDVLIATVYGSRQGLQGVAAEADQSPSEMSRRLNRVDQLPLRVADMIAVLDATKDPRPIYWLIERYLQDPEAQRSAATAQLAAMMPMVQTLLEQALGAGKVRAVK